MPQPLRDVLAELLATRAQVRRFGVNVNQAVRELNATGTPPEWLQNARDHDPGSRPAGRNHRRARPTDPLSAASYQRDGI
ncbi:MAG TPA: hypothetical protein VES02_11090 [Dermatophilaceae bacterium]|nr:hypothetical protein [Dermatophilaceae bacterium]